MPGTTDDQSLTTFPLMPVIVVGADASRGAEIIDALAAGGGEVRAFVSDAAEAARCQDRGIKMAVGDVSDASHVGGAAMGAFTAVFVAAAATDTRERAFASSPAAVFSAWEEAATDAGVQRVIWVGAAGDAPQGMAEVPAGFRCIDPARPDVAPAVASLDAAARLDPGS